MITAAPDGFLKRIEPLSLSRISDALPGPEGELYGQKAATT
jgi:hypothetical protein